MSAQGKDGRAGAKAAILMSARRGSRGPRTHDRLPRNHRARKARPSLQGRTNAEAIRHQAPGAARHGGSARRAGGVRDPRAGAGAGCGGHHARSRRGGAQGGPARFLHRHGHSRGRAARQGVRGPVLRHRGAGGALGLGAALFAHRAGAGQQHLRGRCGQQRRCRALHRLEAQRLAGTLRAGGGGAAHPRPLPRPGRDAHHHPHLALLARLQHPPVEGRGGAEELRRPSGPQVGRQDGQGTPPPTAAPS